MLPMGLWVIHIVCQDKAGTEHASQGTGKLPVSCQSDAFCTLDRAVCISGQRWQMAHSTHLSCSPHSSGSTWLQLLICDSPAGRLGLTVCYDLRFPEVYQTLTWELGAQVLLVPSAFTKVTGAAHWEVLLRARAIECQCYVIAAAQGGVHNEKRESYGHALIIDPWGAIVGHLEDPQATGVAIVDLDFDYLDSIRVKMPIKEHRAKGRQRLARQLPPPNGSRE
eukprot:GHRR01014105.1.p1 GENE.GHRR01014105.1~~GHRR01014105.1.p1  ORF type:complete len:223 (+),score=45.73 GHRR01014105.1:434-1102(+)